MVLEGTCSATTLAWGLSVWHIVILLVIVLLLFGGKKLPELARGLGRGMRIFRDEMHGLKKDFDETENPAPSVKEEPKEPAKPIDVDTTEKK